MNRKQFLLSAGGLLALPQITKSNPAPEKNYFAEYKKDDVIIIPTTTTTGYKIEYFWTVSIYDINWICLESNHHQQYTKACYLILNAISYSRLLINVIPKQHFKNLPGGKENLCMKEVEVLGDYFNQKHNLSYYIGWELNRLSRIS